MVLGGQPPGRVGRRRIDLRAVPDLGLALRSFQSPAVRGFRRSGRVSRIARALERHPGAAECAAVETESEEDRVRPAGELAKGDRLTGGKTEIARSSGGDDAGQDPLLLGVQGADLPTLCLIGGRRPNRAHTLGVRVMNREDASTSLGDPRSGSGASKRFRGAPRAVRRRPSCAPPSAGLERTSCPGAWPRRLGRAGC